MSANTITTYPVSVKFQSRDDIDLAMEQPGVSAIVDKKQGLYYSINVSQTMSELGQVGKLVQLAYAGSKGHPCSVPIIGILSDYQSLIKNSVVASSAFVDACVRSLKIHALAFNFAEKNAFDKSIQMISKCSEMAGKMADISGQLVTESQDLSSKSKEALQAAVKDEVVSAQDRAKVQKSIADAQEAQATLEQLSKSLSEQIAEERAREAKAEKDKKKAARLKVASAVTSIAVPELAPLTAPIGLDANKKEKEAAKNMKDATDARRALQSQQREVNANLAGVVSKVANLNLEKDDLAMSIASLEVVVQSLGKIKTTFENCRRFWMGVKTHCEALKDVSVMELLAEPDFKDEFLDELKDSGFSWLTLGKINLIAFKGITQADSEVDAIMSNLPNSEQAQKLIAPLTKVILQQIENEQEKLLIS